MTPSASMCWRKQIHRGDGPNREDGMNAAIELIITLIVFCLIVGLVVLVWNWICSKFQFGEPIHRGGLWVLGAIAVIWLLRFVVKPLLAG